MKYATTGIVTLLALAVLVAPALAVEPASGSVGAGAAPGDTDPSICVDQRVVGVMSREGGTINDCSYRTGQYAFEGETISYKVMVRDPNGAEDIGNLHIIVDGYNEVLCVAQAPEPTCDGLGEFNPATDKWFTCTYTVEQTDPSEAVEIQLRVYNALNNPTDSIYTENFVFNPALSLSVTPSSGSAIEFEDGVPGDCVHSTNKLLVRNIADGGVNMWMFVAGTDLTDPSGTSICPTTNELAVENMLFRATSGTMQSPWIQMSNYDQTTGCANACGGNYPPDVCYGGKPAAMPPPLGNVLANQGQMEIAFKLCYPVPCIGTFSQGTIYVFGMAI